MEYSELREEHPELFKSIGYLVKDGERILEGEIGIRFAEASEAPVAMVVDGAEDGPNGELCVLDGKLFAKSELEWDSEGPSLFFGRRTGERCLVWTQGQDGASSKRVQTYSPIKVDSDDVCSLSSLHAFIGGELWDYVHEPSYVVSADRRSAQLTYRNDDGYGVLERDKLDKALWGCTDPMKRCIRGDVEVLLPDAVAQPPREAIMRWIRLSEAKFAG